ncbi:MAG TPA: DUF349 domain-containing protein, partial [Candidatus Nanopelagicales bacterium]|nr:DUF349 domain-containing protein [Candidatus Nanopelagicales bacterium]
PAADETGDSAPAEPSVPDTDSTTASETAETATAPSEQAAADTGSTTASETAETATAPSEQAAADTGSPTASDTADATTAPAEQPAAGTGSAAGGDPAAPARPAAPRPGPPPGPRPSPASLAGLSRPVPPRPVAAETAVAEPAAEPPSDSHTFGRVDDDGTVHVRLADGTETAVGQFAAGTPQEGLAFYVRKYDDLSVEVDLAARRLAEGKATPEQAAVVVKRVRESLESPSMVGDLASLTARVDALDALVVERRTAASEARAAAKAAALAAREAIVAEAEQLAESTQWKSTGDRFKALLEDWKAAPRADRTSEQALWKRFSHARSQFDKHRRQYFARLDAERSEAKQVKEALVAEAESLQGSTDWGATAGAYRDLMSRWKASGRAGKGDEDALWGRFRAAQDAFFAARNAALGERDAGFAENLRAKEALLVEAEALDTGDLKSSKAALRGIQERWEKIGHVPRGDKERIEGRLRRVEDAVRRGEQEQWRRTNPEAKARADATVAQFRTSLEKLEKERDTATAAGDTRKAGDAESRIATTRALLEAAERAAEEFSG